MLTIKIPNTEYYNEETSQFVLVKERTIDLEHSLVSLSKWEAKWCKPFLSKDKKSDNEIKDYIRCMIIDRNIPDNIVYALTDSQLNQIVEYIDEKLTATTFSDISSSSKSREIITSEIIYYWMISLNIPFECQKWHLNRLLTLIRVCSIKNSPPKKMSKKSILSRNAQLNATRKQQLNTRG
jgi:hypothetical protein